MQGFIIAQGKLEPRPPDFVGRFFSLPKLYPAGCYYSGSDVMMMEIHEVSIAASPADLYEFWKILGNGEGILLRIRYVPIFLSLEDVGSALFAAMFVQRLEPCSVLLEGHSFIGMGVYQYSIRDWDNIYGKTVIQIVADNSFCANCNFKLNTDKNPVNFMG